MVCRVFTAVACAVSVASASQRSPSAKSIDIRMESAVGSGSKRAFLRSSFPESSVSMLSVEAGGGDAGSDALGLLQDLAPTAGVSGKISDGGASSAMKELGRYPGPISRAQGPAVDPVALDESWHCEIDFRRLAQVASSPDRPGVCRHLPTRALAPATFAALMVCPTRRRLVGLPCVLRRGRVWIVIVISHPRALRVGLLLTVGARRRGIMLVLVLTWRGSTDSMPQCCRSGPRPAAHSGSASSEATRTAGSD